MSHLTVNLHVHPEDLLKVDDSNGTHWLEVGKFTVFCDDADVADRIAGAFTELAARMRAAAHLPETDAGEGGQGLKPCPFCGGEPNMATDYAYGRAPVCVSVGCRQCGFVIQRQAPVESLDVATAEATAAWNRRTPPAQQSLPDPVDIRDLAPVAL